MKYTAILAAILVCSLLAFSVVISSFTYATNTREQNPERPTFTCEDGATAVVTSEPFSYTGDLITKIIVRTAANRTPEGDPCFAFLEDSQTSCYQVRGIGQSRAEVRIVASGRDCDAISHVEYYTQNATPPPTETPRQRPSPTISPSITPAPTYANVLPTESITQTANQNQDTSPSPTPTIPPIGGTDEHSTTPTETPTQSATAATPTVATIAYTNAVSVLPYAETGVATQTAGHMIGLAGVFLTALGVKTRRSFHAT